MTQSTVVHEHDMGKLAVTIPVARENAGELGQPVAYVSGSSDQASTNPRCVAAGRSHGQGAPAIAHTASVSLVLPTPSPGVMKATVTLTFESAGVRVAVGGLIGGLIGTAFGGGLGARLGVSIGAAVGAALGLCNEENR